MPELSYQHCCVDLSWKNKGEVEKLQAFIESAREVSIKTFRRHAKQEDRLSLERRLGYATRPGERGLRCKNDYAVRFLSGKYGGKRAVAIVHSAIEYMFC